jgi:hypothetical protein
LAVVLLATTMAFVSLANALLKRSKAYEG